MNPSPLPALPLDAEPAPMPGALLRLQPAQGSRVFPSWRASLDWREPYLIPLVLLLLTRAILAHLLPLASEDAYITYRFARNLALGYGPVFNPGERVMGFTSPLWTFWNALGWMLTRDPAAWSRGWTLCGDAATLVVAGSMLARHVSRASAWCFTFAFATWTAFTGIAISGMENSMMITLLLLSGSLAECGSPATGPVLALLALIRPEGLAAAVILSLRARWRDRGVALLLVAAAVIGLAWYFGSPLPQSMIAKAQIYGAPGPWAGRHWWEWTIPFSLGRWPAMPDARFLFLLTVLAAPAAFSGIKVLWQVRRTGLAFSIAALLGIWLAYSITGVTYFFWYLMVPLTAWFLLAAMGLPRIVRGATVYVSAALLILGSWTVVWELYAGRAHAENDFAQVATYLEQHSTPWQKVLLEPIGLIGYRVKLRVLDEVGLVSPRIAKRRTQGPGWMTDVIAAEQPEWLVLRRGVVAQMEAFAGVGAPFRNKGERTALLSRYGVETIVDEAAGDAALVVLRRHP